MPQQHLGSAQPSSQAMVICSLPFLGLCKTFAVLFGCAVWLQELASAREEVLMLQQQLRDQQSALSAAQDDSSSASSNMQLQLAAAQQQIADLSQQLAAALASGSSTSEDAAAVEQLSQQITLLTAERDHLQQQVSEQQSQIQGHSFEAATLAHQLEQQYVQQIEEQQQQCSGA